jgi:transposase
MATSARRVRIAPSVRGQLARTARRQKAPHREVKRAQIVLLAEQGLTNAEIARRMSCTEKTVRKWRHRFATAGSVKALRDAPRSGRPARVTVEQRADLVKIACQRPDPTKTAFRSTWTYGALAEVFFATTGVRLSESEVGRILRESELRPHHVRPWLHSPDPEFREKVRRITSLYLSPPPGAHVVCVDEKTGMQALERRFAGSAALPRRAGREEFEYIRHGTATLIAAFDVQTGQVFGECRLQRRASDLLQFMEHLARVYPVGDVYVVWDNLNIHRGPRWVDFNERHGQRFHFVYTPKHASWVNQVEIWFAILQRRVLRHASYDVLTALMTAVEGFLQHWNRHEAHPFRWRFRGRFVQQPQVAA